MNNGILGGYDWEELFNQIKDSEISQELRKNIIDCVTEIDFKFSECENNLIWQIVDVVDENNKACDHFLVINWKDESDTNCCELNILPIETMLFNDLFFSG